MLVGIWCSLLKSTLPKTHKKNERKNCFMFSTLIRLPCVVNFYENNTIYLSVVFRLQNYIKICNAFLSFFLLFFCFF